MYCHICPAEVTPLTDVSAWCGEAYRDQELHDLLLDPPAVMGVEDIGIDQFKIRIVARTQPGRTSTLALWAFFLVTLAVWVLVRPG